MTNHKELRTYFNNHRLAHGLAVFITCSGLITACSSLTKATPTPETPVQTGAGAAAEARVIPIRSSVLSFASSGKIEAIVATEGTSVKKGDTIARLDGLERAQATVAAADLQVASAQKV